MDGFPKPLIKSVLRSLLLGRHASCDKGALPTIYKLMKLLTITTALLLGFNSLSSAEQGFGRGDVEAARKAPEEALNRGRAETPPSRGRA